VYLHTKEPADICGLTDRGALEVGLKADINVIDMEKLRIQHPYVAYELPTGAKIWTQDVIGYDYTIINGVITFKDNVKTGALPGGLVRNPRTQHVRDAGAVSEVDLDFVMAQRGPVRPHEQERNALLYFVLPNFPSRQALGCRNCGNLTSENDALLWCCLSMPMCLPVCLSACVSTYCRRRVR
jgi:hypothetical protein